MKRPSADDKKRQSCGGLGESRGRRPNRKVQNNMPPTQDDNADHMSKQQVV